MDGDDEVVYMVVVNDEEQYSLWRADEPPPKGWSPVGKSGSRTECLEYVKTIWVDMRPASLRRRMDPGSGSA